MVSGLGRQRMFWHGFSYSSVFIPNQVRNGFDPDLPFIPHWDTFRQMQKVGETPTFTRQADKLFSEEERRELIDCLAENPAAGDEIPGTGGVRELRFAALGRGKRGGARVIYFYGGDQMPVYALLAYAKSARTDLNPTERRTLATIVEAIKSAGKERR